MSFNKTAPISSSVDHCVSTKVNTGVKCCFCGSYRYKSQSRFHRFPKDPEISDRWAAISEKKWIIAASVATRYSRYRVCSKHFAQNDYCGYNKMRLHPDAAPKLYTDNKMELDENSQGDLIDDGGSFSWKKNTPKNYVNFHSKIELYRMDFPNRGKCLIFNQKKYEPCTGLHKHPRNGTDSDAAALFRQFKRLKFDVDMFKDSKKNDVLKEITKVAKADHSKNSCFVCCILTHGLNGELYASDDIYTTDELFAPFLDKECKLAGKPKLFFIQACQGCKPDTGVTVTPEEYTDAIDDQAHKIPTHADFLIAYATVPGFASWRYPGIEGQDCKIATQYLQGFTGSWFIQSLCSVLNDHAKDTDLLKMLTIVNGLVANRFPIDPRDKMKQVPCITSTLTKDLKFPPV